MALTPKQEAFAQLLVNGVNQSDAYRRAGYGGDSNGATINNHAYALAHHDDVVARVRELRDLLQAEATWSRAKVVAEAVLNVEKARNLNQIAASNGALGLIIDVQGLKVHKIEHTANIDHHVLPNLSEEQLRALVAKAERAALEQGLNVVEGEIVDD